MNLFCRLVCPVRFSELYSDRYSMFQIRVVNAFQQDLDAFSGMDSYDKRSRPSVISLQSLQAAQKAGGVSRKPNLPSSPEREEPPRGAPWMNRQESIPYADE